MKLYIIKAVAFHLGQLKCGCDSEELNEDLVENADERILFLTWTMVARLDSEETNV